MHARYTVDAFKKRKKEKRREKSVADRGIGPKIISIIPKEFRDK